MPENNLPTVPMEMGLTLVNLWLGYFCARSHALDDPNLEPVFDGGGID